MKLTTTKECCNITVPFLALVGEIVVLGWPGSSAMEIKVLIQKRFNISDNLIKHRSTILFPIW